MDTDPIISFPSGAMEGSASSLTIEEERTLTRESTASFAGKYQTIFGFVLFICLCAFTDWVTLFLHRVFALFENLPEEGGTRNTTGGRQEDTLLHSLRHTLDVVFIHLSDPLFDHALRLVYNYATSNAKANAVRAFGHLVSSLAKAHPEKTIDKFLPFCAAQIKEELKHGASSIRTTSSSTAVPSDTQLHWSESVLFLA